MKFRGGDLALGLFAAGTAATVGYFLKTEYARRRTAAANIGARVVEPEDIPTAATVVDDSSRRLRELPGVQKAIEKAVAQRDHWANVTIERSDALTVVDGIRDSLPYYRAADEAELSGLYVKRGDRLIVLDAFGWDVLEGTQA
ncbi:MAG: hypothetical protein U5K37_10845 [Natrialbaceae archaeon]|nr:hypothetical protein [Natrialbaceae archaeon]